MPPIKPVTPKQSTTGKLQSPIMKCPDAYFLNKPCFCFQYLQKGKYHLDSCCGEDKVSLIERLVVLSGLTWLQMHSSHVHAYGVEKINRKQIHVALPSVVTDDISLIAIRFTGNNKPMLGFRSNNIFHILFLDHDFTLYDHG